MPLRPWRRCAGGQNRSAAKRIRPRPEEARVHREPVSVYIYIYIYMHMFGGIPCLTLLVSHRLSSKVANDIANYHGP